MAQKYNHQSIEKKWQAAWDKQKIWETKKNSNDPKSCLSADRFYVLDMFPYPSAEGLHVGHPEGYTASDIIARYLRMNGKNVLHPMGFDSFGLPAENYAIKTGTHPAITTKKNIDTMRKQIKALGFSYDWSREVITSDPAYYKWTQWIFVQLFKHGLAYEADAPINWCPSCKTGLANEEVVNGKCERCGTEVTKKQIKQWLVKITDKKYIERLLNDLDRDEIEWPESIKLLQRNWIGKSEGATIQFCVIASGREAISRSKDAEIAASPEISLGSSPCLPAGRNDIIKVFTTRPDTLFGATYMVLSPEHPLVDRVTTAEQKKEVAVYVKKTQSKSDLERTDLAKEKTGVFTGAYAINPVNNKKIPVWIADYVLISYGTGAIMAVPAHDERDWEFAKKYKLPINEVVQEEKTARKHCVLVHGSPREPDEMNDIPHSQRHWRGWLKKELEQRGYIVDAPEMPIPWKPDYQAWKKEFEKIKISNNSVLIGHSAGGAFIARWLSENKRVVKKVILLSPGKAKLDHNKRLHDFYSFKIDKSIAARVEKIVLFTSDNEKWYRKQNIQEYNVAWGAQVITLHKTGHFVFRDMGREEFPELLEAVLGQLVFTGEGVVINSGKFSGLKTVEFKKKITTWLEKNNVGKKAVNYKLRDWLFSRQRYWGEPIPIVHCEKCGNVAVPEKELPVELPDIKKYEPTGTGESPLAAIEKWVNTKCPECGGKAKRETNTMPQWAGSNWYFLRYCDPHNKKQLADPKRIKEWMPVNLYIGGAEHAVLHLLYARFIYKFLFDIGVVPRDVGDEPFKKLKNQGLIMGEDGVKMSKSRGNVVNPDDVIKKYGADTMRMYEMFMGPFEDSKPWDTKGIIGIKRFLKDRVWVTLSKIINDVNQNKLERKDGVSRAIHKAIKGVTKDIEGFKFNTAISWLMIFFNQRDWGPKLNSEGKWEAVSDIGVAVDLDAVKKFLKILSPFAPHITEHLWQLLHGRDPDAKNFVFKKEYSIAYEKWPVHDERKLKELEEKIVVQVNGKVRATIITRVGATEDEIQSTALSNSNIKKYITVKPKKVIFVKGRLINFVV